jgi:hypothetical protein
VAASAAVFFGCTATAGNGDYGRVPGGELRAAMREVWERQTVRPPAALRRTVDQTLASIAAIEGRTDPRLAAALSDAIREAWDELERARALAAAGYRGFDPEAFQGAEARFHDVLMQFADPRGAFGPETYRAALAALAGVRAGSRAARRALLGLPSDDVRLMREKRQQLLRQAPDGGPATGRFIGIEVTPAR